MNYLSSNQTFREIWHTKGIYAILFGGHGTIYGFVADPSSGTAVGPHQVAPPYHLAAVMAYSCYSADAIWGNEILRDGTVPVYFWKTHVSNTGRFFGYKGLVSWINEHSIKETVNNEVDK